MKYNQTYIYGLLDPNTFEVKYIGQSVRPFDRVGQHISDSQGVSTSAKNQWIRSLLKKKQRPYAVLFERVGIEDAHLKETEYIKKYKGSILNTHPHGTNPPNTNKTFIRGFGWA